MREYDGIKVVENRCGLKRVRENFIDGKKKLKMYDIFYKICKFV